MKCAQAITTRSAVGKIKCLKIKDEMPEMFSGRSWTDIKNKVSEEIFIRKVHVCGDIILYLLVSNLRGHLKT